MQHVLPEIITLLVMVLLIGALSMVEVAVVSSRRSRLRQWCQAGDRRARAALELVESPARLLSTVQIGITAGGVFAGAFGGITLAGMLGRWLAEIPLLAAVAGPLAVTLVVAVITVFMLVLGELVPKQIGLARPEQIARATARPMQRLSCLIGPLAHLLAASSNALLRLLRVQPPTNRQVSEEEVKLLVREGQRAGALLPEETRMVEQVLDLDQLTVRDLMQTRGDMVWLDLEEPAEQNRQRILASGHSRFPVFRGRRDNLQGVISIKDLHEQAVAGKPFDIEAVLANPLLVPPTQSAIVLMRSFRNAGTTFALVIDEFGGVDGLVTLHDVMRAIVGVLPDEPPDARPRAEPAADGSWTVDALIRLDDLEEILPDLPELDDGPQTLTFNGLLIRHCGRIPEAGEQIELGGYRVEILRRDDTRVQTARIVVRNGTNTADPAAPEQPNERDSSRPR